MFPIKKLAGAGTRNKVISLIIIAICLFSMAISDTLAWCDFKQSKLSEFSGHGNIYSVILNKYEKDIDGNATTIPVQNANFDLYKEDSDGIATKTGGPYITDENGQIKVQELSMGNYYFLEISPSYGYDYDKDGEGEITKYHFTINKDRANDGTIEVIAYNQRLFADFETSQTVENTDDSKAESGDNDSDMTESTQP